MNEHSSSFATSHRSQVEQLEQFSDEEFWTYARALAGSVPQNKAAPGEYLECRLSTCLCLIPLTELYEVVSPPQQWTILPITPPWMPGIAAWRGETIAVIDLDAYLSGNTTNAASENMLLIARNDEQIPYGILIPSIGPIQHIAPDQITPLTHLPLENIPLQASITSVTSVLQGMYGEALMLNIPALLADTMQQIQNDNFI